MQRFFRATTAIVALGLSLSALAGCSGGGSAGAAGGVTATTGKPTLVPGPGQAFVTGTVVRFVADDAQTGQPLASPFTLTSAERGTGNATIQNALVGGKRSTISWATGTPLPITGGKGLDLGAAHIQVDATGVTWQLDGAARNLVPGDYHAGAPVAVGTGGIAAPRDAVDFTADDRTVITSRGGVVVHLDPRPVEITGPGRLSVSGSLRVTTPSSAKAASTVTFGPGPFKATLVPGGSGPRLDGVLQGTFTAA